MHRSVILNHKTIKQKYKSYHSQRGYFYAYCVQVAGLLRNMNKVINIRNEVAIFKKFILQTLQLPVG